MLGLCRGEKAKATLNAVVGYDDNYTVAALSFGGYTTSFANSFKDDDGMANITKKIGQVKSVIAVCSLLQAMYKKYNDEGGRSSEAVRSAAVKAALGKAPKSGAQAVHKRIYDAANSMVQ